VSVKGTLFTVQGASADANSSGIEAMTAKTAMHYQHPELEVVRAAPDCGMPNDVAEARA
jgi:hypothetical protein